MGLFMNNRLNAFLLLISIFASFARAMEVPVEEALATEATAPSPEKAALWQQFGLKYIWENEYHANFETRNVLAYEPMGQMLFNALVFHFFYWYKKQRASDEESDGSGQKLVPNRPVRMPLTKGLFDSSALYDTLIANKVEHVIFQTVGDRSLADGVSIKRVEEINGYGAFANKEFKNNEIIGEYTGRVYYGECYRKSSKVVADQVQGPLGYFINDIAPLFREKDASDDYICQLSGQHPYFFANTKDKAYLKYPLIVDAQKYRNEMAFANHSERFSNARLVAALKVIVDETPDGKLDIKSAEFAVYLLATETIKKEIEIECNYGYIKKLLRKKNFRDRRPERACYRCNSAGDLQECIGCHVALYCNDECRLNDFDEHKNLCEGCYN